MDTYKHSKYIFITGFSRSGTTFLQSLIATQKNIISFPETHFFDLVTNNIKPHQQIEFKHLQSIQQKLNQYFKHSFSQSEVTVLCKKIEKKELTKKVLFEYLLISYCSQKKIQINNQSVFLEKTPDHARNIFELHTLFPEAHFFCIFRHPIAAIQSHKENLSMYSSSYEELAHSWVHNVNSILKFRKINSNKLFLLKYESLKENYPIILKNTFSDMELIFEAKELENYRQKINDIILPFEVWKQKNKLKNVQQTSTKKYAQKIPILKLLLIQKIMRKEMYSLNYKSFSYFLQRGYNIFYPSILKVYSVSQRILKRTISWINIS